MKRKSPFYFLLLFLMETYPASPQEIFFNKVLPPEGQVFSHVSGIVQDKYGYMWLATKKGLFKYDGYQMTNYKNNPDDSNSLATDFLEAICIDSSGIIWIAAQNRGLKGLILLPASLHTFLMIQMIREALVLIGCRLF
jgi:hypothetical protein